jgi:hypothetical protein
MVDRPPLEDTDVQISLPQDVVLTDVAEMADLVNLSVSTTSITAPNPRIDVYGGPGVDAILFWITSSGAASYIALRFLDHVLDDAFAKVLARLAETLRSRRRAARGVDELPWFVWTFVNSMDEKHEETLTLTGRFEGSDELERMGRHARDLIGTYDDAGIRDRSVIWRRKAGVWEPYRPEAGEPDDS